MNIKNRRVLVAAALIALPTLLIVKNNASAAPLPTVARFHLALAKSEPAANDTAASVKAIKLWFTETVTVAATGIQVTGPDKKIVVTTPVTIAAAAKSPAVAEFKEALKPGAYTVDWKTLADDGHPSKGSFVFTVGAKKAAK